MIAKIKNLTEIISTQLLVIFLWSHYALADCQGGDAAACLKNTTPSVKKIYTDIEVGLNALSIAVGVVATIMLIYGGIQYITSNGNAEQVTAAKKKIVDVIIGVVAYALLYVFLQWLIPGGIFS